MSMTRTPGAMRLEWLAARRLAPAAKALLAGAALGALCACGGGGGSDSPATGGEPGTPTTPTTPPAEVRWTVGGTVSGLLLARRWCCRIRARTTSRWVPTVRS